jgi:putative transposase
LVEASTLEKMISWFNHQRLLGSIGYIPPAEAEENYYRPCRAVEALAA